MRVLLAVAVFAMLVLVGCLQSGTSGVDEADATPVGPSPTGSSASSTSTTQDPGGNEPPTSTSSDDTTNPPPANSTSDADGVGNGAGDCPDASNPGQSDANGDGTGDACDGDVEGEELVSGTPRLALSFTGFLRTQPHGAAFSSIAAGLDRVLASTHGEVGLFLKDGGLVDRRSHADFFRSVLPTGEGLTDPRVSYDYQSDRFFVVAASGKGGSGCDPDDCPNTWTVAVSKMASPQTLTPEDWFFWAFDATLTEGEPSGLWGDFSIVASDGRLVVINGQMVQHHPGPPDSVYERLWVFDKSDFMTGQPIPKPEKEFYNIQDPKTGNILRQRFLPATNLEDPGGIFFVHFGDEDCDIIVGQVSTTAPGENPGPASKAELVVRNVPVPGKACRETIPATQLGGGPPIRIHPHITSAPVYHDGSLWIAQVVPIHYTNGSVNGVRILKLDVSAWPETPTVEEDQTLSEEDVSYAYPAISISRAGDVVVVFNRLSPSTYISLYYTGRLATDPAGTFHDAVPFMPGKAYHDYPGSSENFLLAGAHSGAALDPIDDSVWLMGQYAERPCVWGARIAQVVFTDGGEAEPPPPPAINGGQSPCVRPTGSPY